MPNNVLNPKNLRWLTVYLFLGLMVLLLALNLFVPSNSGAAANNSTPTSQRNNQSDLLNCKGKLHLLCTQVIHAATANAVVATSTANQKATAAAHKIATASAKASATAATATAVITATANANATATAKAKP